MPRALLLPGLMGTGECKRAALIQAGFDVHVVTFDDHSATDWQQLFKAPVCHLLSIVMMLTTARRIYRNWVAQAQAAYDSIQPDIVIGASRGGSVALTMQIAQSVPIVLLAPAYKWFRWIGGRTSTTLPNVVVIHSRQDESIPFTDSVEFCRKCPQAKLIEAGSDHALNSADAIPVWVKAARESLTQ